MNGEKDISSEKIENTSIIDFGYAEKYDDLPEEAKKLLREGEVDQNYKLYLRLYSNRTKINPEIIKSTRTMIEEGLDKIAKKKKISITLCSNCKRISKINFNPGTSESSFSLSHGICEDCKQELYPELSNEGKNDQ